MRAARWLSGILVAGWLAGLGAGCAAPRQDVSTDPRSETLRGPEPIARFRGPFGRDWEWIPGGWSGSER